jgi:hypothetical protein
MSDFELRMIRLLWNQSIGGGNFEAGVLGLHGTETALQREVVFDRFFCGNTRRCREDVEDPSTMNCVRFLPEALTDTGTHGAEP